MRRITTRCHPGAMLSTSGTLLSTQPAQVVGCRARVVRHDARAVELSGGDVHLDRERGAVVPRAPAVDRPRGVREDVRLVVRAREHGLRAFVSVVREAEMLVADAPSARGAAPSGPPSSGSTFASGPAGEDEGASLVVPNEEHAKVAAAMRAKAQRRTRAEYLNGPSAGAGFASFLGAEAEDPDPTRSDR